MSSKLWWKEPTRGQWLTFFAAWIGWVMDAFDFTIFLLVMPEIAWQFGVSDAATSLTVSLTLATRLLGSFVAGSVADRFGRKLPLLISVVWFAACDGAIAFAPAAAGRRGGRASLARALRSGELALLPAPAQHEHSGPSRSPSGEFVDEDPVARRLRAGEPRAHVRAQLLLVRWRPLPGANELCETLRWIGYAVTTMFGAHRPARWAGLR